MTKFKYTMNHLKLLTILSDIANNNKPIDTAHKEIIKLLNLPSEIDIEKAAEENNDTFWSSPVNHSALVALGFSHWAICDYYCPPLPANGATYRVHFRARETDKNRNPVKGTEKWEAYLPLEDPCPFLQEFKTLKELNYFHKGMCGEWLSLNRINQTLK